MNKFGCSFLESGIDFEPDKICDCCISHNDGRGQPLLIENYDGQMINWEELFNVKAERIASQKEKTIYDCENCYHLCEWKFSYERKISEFHFTQCRFCNAKCIYCSEEFNSSNINYDVLPVLNDLIDKGYYKSGGEATFQGGEPTLMKNFDKIIHLFSSNGTTVRVHTSGIKYSSTCEEALRKNNGTVVISLDSGCTKTYKRIKQVDCFYTVCETIQKYSLANSDNVIIKYIIIPGVNDNIKEIDAFFRLMKNYGIKTVALDLEVRYARTYENKYVSPHIFLLADYFENRAKKLNIRCIIYSFISYVLQNRKLKKSKIVKNKFLCGLYISMLNDKDKNLTYSR